MNASIALVAMLIFSSVGFAGGREENRTIESVLREVEGEILEADSELKTESDAIDSDGDKIHAKSESKPGNRIPIETNERVQKWIRFFSQTDRERFYRFLVRGNSYRPLVKRILKENGVPAELYYLAMIESGFVTHAKSSAKAIGIWQFMPGTGIRYGLALNREVDERRDIVRATEAAAKYLKNLNTAFQSWYLAIAGYNAGEGRILGAVMRGGSRNFWDLVEKKALPPETRDYVPKFLAAVIIGNNPKKYGFTNIESTPFPEVEAASIPGRVSLAAVAAQLKIPTKDLKTLNPHLMQGRTPSHRPVYSLWIPKGEGARLSVPQLVQSRIVSPKKNRTGKFAMSNAGSKTVHRVRKGDFLNRIASRYDVSIRRLKRANALTSNEIFVGQKLRIPKDI